MPFGILKIFDEGIFLSINCFSSFSVIEIILKSRSVLWNGPLGAFEYSPFDKSTIEVANLLKKYSNELKIDTLAGGGDTLSAINKAKAKDAFSYLSNAGGAFLEWLEGKKSPGAIALEKNNYNYSSS